MTNVDVRLGQHFMLSEFCISRSHPELVEWPNGEELANLTRLVALVLDPLRRKVGTPVVVTSGYRSPRLNEAIKGSPTSDHLTGRAADIRASGWTSGELARVIIDLGCPYDQLIWYAPSRGGHLHVGLRVDANRYEVRHAAQGGGMPLQEP